ncbi:MAG: 30S ribosomal protein S20 [Elusimicrobia bacterium]|nr:30S ribosomal protein S20 [Elusimicrobiota bacterium]
MAKLKTGRHTGAIKTHRQALRRTARNRVIRRKARDAAKDFLEAVTKKDKGAAAKLLGAVASTWDKAAKKGTIHWKTAARRKSRLAARLNKTAA